MEKKKVPSPPLMRAPKPLTPILLLKHHNPRVVRRVWVIQPYKKNLTKEKNHVFS